MTPGQEPFPVKVNGSRDAYVDAFVLCRLWSKGLGVIPGHVTPLDADFSLN